MSEEIDEEKIAQAEEIAQIMYDDGVDNLEILEYITLAIGLTETESEILVGTLEMWDAAEEQENY